MAKARMLGYQKTGATNAKAAPPYWQVKRGNDCLCNGFREQSQGVGGKQRVSRDGASNVIWCRR